MNERITACQGQNIFGTELSANMYACVYVYVHINDNEKISFQKLGIKRKSFNETLAERFK